MDSTRVVLVKYLIYFMVGTNTEYFRNIPEEKFFSPLRILKLSIKSFVNPFADTALNFLDSSFNSVSPYVTSFSLLSKFVFFTKLAISFWLAKS